MTQIEFETSFGLVAASEQALVDALRELLRGEDHAADDSVEPLGS